MELPKGTNTLAYYEHSLLAAVKSFITLGSGPIDINKLFSVVISDFFKNKLECCLRQEFPV